VARRALLTVDPEGAAGRAVAAWEHADVRLYGEDHEMASLVATVDGDVAGGVGGDRRGGAGDEA
jgi:hypothetical protein